MLRNESTESRQASTSRLTPEQITLFLHALRLSFRAQELRRGESLHKVIRRLSSKSNLPRQVEPLSALRAASRAGRVVQWLGYLNSCLMRSLVAGMLLSDREGVVLHIGVLSRDGSGGPLTGHAWLSLDGSVIPSPKAEKAPDGRVYRKMTSVALRRRRPT